MRFTLIHAVVLRSGSSVAAEIYPWRNVEIGGGDLPVPGLDSEELKR